ncbi:signal peptidase II [Quadrisphaera setariae]|uniref:Signal peptidase II n=1 Tax=Quadrisphaera setariae TaxID=2593304 RepID=A0A5C8Z331_9ACTN|nr:signal peptidase II [Streptomyces sp. NP160]TXR52505.1 signal peptidase II [Quadrisphaera setariae]
MALLVAAAAAGLDQVTKAVAERTLDGSAREPLLGDFLGLQLSFNPGSVLGLGSGSTWLLTVAAGLAFLALTRAALWAPSRGWALATGLLWGGVTGNLLDRLLAPPRFGQGHVTDFLTYGHLFIGNLADVWLTFGAALAAVLLMGEALQDPSAQHPVQPPGHPQQLRERK